MAKSPDTVCLRHTFEHTLSLFCYSSQYFFQRAQLRRGSEEKLGWDRSVVVARRSELGEST